MNQASTPAGSLPGSSPPPATSDFEEEEILGQEDGDLDDGEEEDGEDLFGDEMGNDYIENRKLDAYDAGDLNDDEDFSDDADARRAAEDRMDRRDRRAARAAGAVGERRKARVPQFLASDEEDSEDEGGLLGRRRQRRNYDEPMGDDEAGFDDVRTFLELCGRSCANAHLYVTSQEMPIEQLSDIRADSLAQWIEDPRTKKTIMREFKNFLLTYTDENNESTYGSRINQLGQRELE